MDFLPLPDAPIEYTAAELAARNEDFDDEEATIESSSASVASGDDAVASLAEDGLPASADAVAPPAGQNGEVPFASRISGGLAFVLTARLDSHNASE